jgi:mono/diheme cytochrome c family protein
MRHKFYLIPLLSLVAIIASACGGGGAGPTPTSAINLAPTAKATLKPAILQPTQIDTLIPTEPGASTATPVASLTPTQLAPTGTEIATLPPTQPGATTASQPTAASSGPPTPLPTGTGSYPPVPAEYANKQPPFSLTSSDTINKGKAIYNSDCAPCHGANGKGDGPAAASLNPPPLDFASVYSKNMPLDFRYWRISAGVANTAMPAWGSSLSSDEIWQVIAYEMTFEK